MYKNYNSNGYDQGAETQPSKPYRGEVETPSRKEKLRVRWLVLFILLLAGYLFFPSKHTLLILGIDQSFENTAMGRSDTNLLVRVRPFSGSVSILSIPRDLWVTIPGYGENRINTAHFYGEGKQPGQGPYWAMKTVEYNFETDVNRYIRIQLENFPELVDALGGIEITLETNMAGYSAGTHLLNGTQALAFVGNRAGADDFFRMAQGQVFLKSLLRAILDPANWPRLPAILGAAGQTIATNIPMWQIPRIGVAVVRAYLFDQINFLVIQREHVTSWVTDLGAQVLLPDWYKINLLIKEDF